MPKTREQLEEVVASIIDNHTYTTDEGDYVIEEDDLEIIASEIVEAVLFAFGQRPSDEEVR